MKSMSLIFYPLLIGIAFTIAFMGVGIFTDFKARPPWILAKIAFISLVATLIGLIGLIITESLK